MVGRRQICRCEGPEAGPEQIRGLISDELDGRRTICQSRAVRGTFSAGARMAILKECQPAASLPLSGIDRNSTSVEASQRRWDGESEF
jgi:hypothetical protein